MLEIEFLGTGTSTGVPQIRCKCPVCMSTDPHDKRLRTSAIVRYRGKTSLLIAALTFAHKCFVLPTMQLTHS